MIVPLIPLVLAASINVNESDWKYGPEVIYETKIDGQSPVPNGSATVMVTFNTTMKLACRPKSELVLFCDLREPTTVVSRWNIDDDHIMENSRKYHEAIPEATSFEFNFDPKIESPIVVTSSMDVPRLNLIRALIAVLNIGANFSMETSHIFETVSNTVGGKCKVRYDLQTRKVLEEDAKKNEKNLRLSMIALPHEKPIKGEVREIDRGTYLFSCMLLYYSEGGVQRKHRLSSNHAIVTEGNFTSYSYTEVYFLSDSPRKNWTSIGSERITMILDKVVPATGPLPQIIDPISVGIRATKIFQSDTFLDYFENKLYDDWLSLADYVNKTSNQENNTQSVTQ